MEKEDLRETKIYLSNVEDSVKHLEEQIKDFSKESEVNND